MKIILSFERSLELPHLLDYKPSDFLRNLDLNWPKKFPTKGFGLYRQEFD